MFYTQKEDERVEERKAALLPGMDNTLSSYGNVSLSSGGGWRRKSSATAAPASVTVGSESGVDDSSSPGSVWQGMWCVLTSWALLFYDHHTVSHTQHT